MTPLESPPPGGQALPGGTADRGACTHERTVLRGEDDGEIGRGTESTP